MSEIIVPNHQLLQIPSDLRTIDRWTNWRYVDRGDGKKPTKPPINPNTGQLASVTDPTTWGTFEQCVRNFETYPDYYSGVGFMFSSLDDYALLDMDGTKGDPEKERLQQEIIDWFGSYTELSPSGNGVHIIVRTKQKAKGARKDWIEMYTQERFGTFTGNSIGPVDYITDKDSEWKAMFDRISADRQQNNYEQAAKTDLPQTDDDRTIYDRAAGATNGTKFLDLWNGDWKKHYGSQSEADIALMNMFCYYTKNREQCARLFRTSALGKRDKAQREDYVQGMITKGFDNDLPPVDISAMSADMEQHKEEIKEELSKFSGTIGSQKKREAWTLSKIHDFIDNLWEVKAPGRPPEGLVAEIADYIQSSSYLPMYESSLLSAFGMVAGMTGCAYNVNGTGLNLFQLLVMPTGFGKEQVSSGISSIYKAVIDSGECPSADLFSGPADFSSGQALIKHVEQQKSFCSIMDEFGLTLQRMTGRNARDTQIEFRKQLLQLYNKSGYGNVMECKAYAQLKDNIVKIENPGVSLIGMSTPETFYAAVTEELVEDGLLPRMDVLEYDGLKQLGRDGMVRVPPSKELVSAIATLADTCHKIIEKKLVTDVKFDDQAREFFRWINEQMLIIENYSPSHITQKMFTRVGMRTIRRAAILAVSRSFYNPIITLADMHYAFNMVWYMTLGVYARFREGTYGDMTHDDNKVREIMRMCLAWHESSYADVKDYFNNEDMHKAHIIPRSYLQRRLSTNKAFRHNHKPSSQVLKETVNDMVDRGDLVRIDQKITIDKFGFRGDSLAIPNIDRIREVLK